MIHPSAAARPLDKPLHRSFLLGAYLTGTLGLLVLPFHLAFAGAPTGPVIVLLAYLLAQWPLAHHLSRSGRLDHVLAASSALFACFVAAFCALTGGLHSFALIWVLVPIAETVLVSHRRITLAIFALTCGLLAGLFVLSAGWLVTPPVTVMVPGWVMMVSSLVAVLYSGGVVLRVVADRKASRHQFETIEDMRRMMSLGASEVSVELKASGAVRLLGGPVQSLLGGGELPKTADGIFERMHVVDRPLYLTRLSEARHAGVTSQFCVRMKNPDDGTDFGRVDQFNTVTIRLVPVPTGERAGPDGHDVVLTLQIAATAMAEAAPEVGRRPAPSGLPWDLVHRLVQETRAPVERAVSIGGSLLRSAEAGRGDGALKAAEQICQLGQEALFALDAFSDQGDLTAADGALSTSDADLTEIIGFCRRVAEPLAVRKGITLAVHADRMEAVIPSGALIVRKSLCLVLHGAIEAADQGGHIRISCAVDRTSATITVTLKNRTGLKGWTAPLAMSALDNVRRMIEGTGGALETRAALGAGESVVMSVPLMEKPGAGRGLSSQAARLPKLASSA